MNDSPRLPDCLDPSRMARTTFELRARAMGLRLSATEAAKQALRDLTAGAQDAAALTREAEDLERLADDIDSELNQ